MVSQKNPTGFVVTALGDIPTFNGTAPDILSVGSDTNVLISDSTQPKGLRWGTQGSGIQTYMPTVFGQTTAGTVLYNSQAGYYYIMGNLCIASIRLNFSIFTGTGNMLFTLPNTALAGQLSSIGNCMFDGAYTTYTNVCAQIIPNSANVNLIIFGNGSDAQVVQQCVAAAVISFTVFYQIASNP